MISDPAINSQQHATTFPINENRYRSQTHKPETGKYRTQILYSCLKLSSFKLEEGVMRKVQRYLNKGGVFFSTTNITRWNHDALDITSQQLLPGGVCGKSLLLTDYG